MVDLGYNYRITDFQCALGISQLKKLDNWMLQRQSLAKQYDAAFTGNALIEPLYRHPDRTHAYHLYVVRLAEHVSTGRSDLFGALRAEGIGVNVHYIPVHLHPFYRDRFGTEPGACPAAEKAYERLLTLPLFPQMDEEDIDDVVMALDKVLR